MVAAGHRQTSMRRDTMTVNCGICGDKVTVCRCDLSRPSQEVSKYGLLTDWAIHKSSFERNRKFAMPPVGEVYLSSIFDPKACPTIGYRTIRVRVGPLRQLWHGRVRRS